MPMACHLIIIYARSIYKCSTLFFLIVNWYVSADDCMNGKARNCVSPSSMSVKKASSVNEV